MQSSSTQADHANDADNGLESRGKTPAQQSASSFASADSSAQISAARREARRVFRSGAHAGLLAHRRRTLTTARDTVVVLSVVYAALLGGGFAGSAYAMFAGILLGVPLLIGISAGRSTHARVRFYVDELEHERRHIRENLEGERDELRALYAAKGFREPLLSQIVDIISSDDDRLLKVMLEEELGFSLYHVEHPLVVGATNVAVSFLIALACSLPVLVLTVQDARWWMPAVGGAVLLGIALIDRVATGRSAAESFAEGAMIAGVAGGAAYFAGQWIASAAPAG